MKLLICDDDISTIDFVQNNLDCNELGISKIMRAYNGLTAKQIIEAEHPEIILCDIGMPQCNGIEVLKFVSKSGYHPEFAFLTCYESFEYAREAVRYDATNYLTKPLDPKELKEALLKMTATVRAQRLAQEQKEGDLQRKDLLLNNFLQRLRDDFYGEDKKKIEAALKRHNLGMSADTPVRCILVCADVTNALQNGWETDLLRYSFNYLAQEVIAERQDFAYSIADADERFITLTILMEATKLTEQEITRRCDYLISVCRSNLFLLPVCLVGEEMPLYHLPETFTALHKRLYKIRLQGGHVHLYREAENIAENNAAPALTEAKILASVKQNDKTAYLGEISAVANKIAIEEKGSDCGIALLHHDLIQVFTDYLHDNAIPVRALFQDETIRELDSHAERSVFDMMNFSIHLFDYVVNKLQGLGETEDVINKVKRYISSHFRENIDRDSVSAIAYVTPNYLSKRFRSEVGMNMREYINQLRIGEAKRLLLSTNASISKIATTVGFDNISYFSTVFRKQCGMSPADWKNEKHGGGKDETERSDL